MMKKTLQEGLPQLGLELSDAVCDQLCAFGAAVVKQNEVMNLTAITEDAQVAKLHLLDSLILLLYDDRRRCLLYLVLLLYWIAHVMSLLHRVPVLSHVVSCAYIGMRWLTMMN